MHYEKFRRAALAAVLAALVVVSAIVAAPLALATTAPINLTATTASGPSVTLSWSPAPSTVNHVDLYRTDFASVWKGSIPNSQTSFTNDEALSPGASYTYALYACASAAECKVSADSDTVASDTVTITAAGGSTPSPTPTPTPPAGQTCDVTAAPGQSFSSLMTSLGARTTACLPAGTYNWGDYVVPAGKTIQGSSDAGVATIVGEAVINNPGVTLRDLKLQAASNETHAVVDGKASNFVGQYLDVNTNHVGGVQGFIVGGSSSPAPSNFKILDTVIHGPTAGGSLTATQVHAIYWQNGSGTGNEVGRVWMYDVSGYGLHFYSGSSGAKSINVDVHNTVADDLPNRGHLLDNTTGSTIRDSILTDASTVTCRPQAGNVLSNIRSQGGFSGCSGTGLVTADTTYYNEAARDYRTDVMPGMTFIPGPRY